MLYVLTITFMSVDWVMSLDPHWYSTIFGILTLGGQGLSTLAFTILVLAALVKFQPMSQVADAEQLPRPRQADVRVRDAVGVLQRLAAAHHLVGEPAGRDSVLPRAAARRRGRRSASLLLLGQFVLPFLLLLSRDLKRNPRSVQLGGAASSWSCASSTSPGRSARCSATRARRLHWLDFAVVLGMGGSWLVVVLAQPGGPRAGAGARPVLQGSDGSWRTLITRHAAPIPVEGDGVSYSGIVWFVVILTVTTLVCQLLVVGLLRVHGVARGRARMPRARRWRADRAQPAIEGGRVVTGTPESPQPALLVDEPIELRELPRRAKTSSLSTYGWVDQNAGTVRIPIDRAKDLLLERGLAGAAGAPRRPRVKHEAAGSRSRASPAAAAEPAGTSN